MLKWYFHFLIYIKWYSSSSPSSLATYVNDPINLSMSENHFTLTVKKKGLSRKKKNQEKCQIVN